jgi:hypothetical protein
MMLLRGPTKPSDPSSRSPPAWLRAVRPVLTREDRNRRCRVGRGGESPRKVPRPAAGSASFKRPTEETLREEGADGASNPARLVEGTVMARHAVMPPPSPEPYRSGESVRGASAWRPDGSCAAGGKVDAPLTEN